MTSSARDLQPPHMQPPDLQRSPLDEATATQVRELSARAAGVDGVEPLSEQPLLSLTSDAPLVHLLSSGSGGALTGYAQLDLGAPGAASAELVVDPAARRRGVGRQLLDAAREVAAQDQAADPAGRRFSVWAHGDIPAAQALAAAAGLRVVRELWLMGADLAPLAQQPVPALPSGVGIRAFAPGQDEEAWRRVNARAFAGHPEQGRITRQDLDARIAAEWFDPAGFLLAERDDVLLGSIWMKVHPDGEGGQVGQVGEIYVLGVDPDAQGFGLGGALTRRGLEYLVGRGIERAILYTEADNEVALQAYRRTGFERIGVDVQYG